jgi:hypothetical protein
MRKPAIASGAVHHFSVGSMKRTQMQRLCAKIRLPEDPIGCWEWLAGKGGSGGYGTFRIGNKTAYAHRICYELFVGPIPVGLGLDHFRCDNPGCVNPLHVRPATDRENLLRSDITNSGKMHCPQGHPYAGDNLWIDSCGNRHCRACWPAHNRDHYRKRTTYSHTTEAVL